MGDMTVPLEVQRASLLMAELLGEFFSPPPQMTVTEWAEQHRYLSAKDSSEPGQYRVERTPYALEPQDALSANSPIEEVILMWGAQTSKTTILNNWVGYTIDTQPGPMMIVQPTLDLAKRYSRQRLASMIEESPRLKKKVKQNRSRDDANTTLLKEFPGGYLAITGANSAAGLRSMPIRDIAFDETDAYPDDVDGEGDPIKLAEARQTTFPRRKRCKTSTPTVEGFSKIDKDFKASDQRLYMIRCPHCGEHQALEMGVGEPWGLKWSQDENGVEDPLTAHYVCRSTGCIIEEHEKSSFLLCEELGGTAYWSPQNSGSKKRGYRLPTLYSPLGWFSWASMAEEWIAARTAQDKGDHTLMKTFVNTREARTYNAGGDKVSASELAGRLSNRKLGVVPLGGLLLTMGVDTQPNRLELRVWAWGRDERAWLVDVEVIWGDPNLPEGAVGSPWNRLTERRMTMIPTISGSQLSIEATAIDTGGANTQAVYAYCREHSRSNVLAIKGASQPNRPPLGRPGKVDVTVRGRMMSQGLQLWPVGTDTIKHLLHGRLRLKIPGPGYIDLPHAIATTDEISQLTAETLIINYLNGHAKTRWWKPNHIRNEATDCFNYAYAAACWKGLNRMRDVDWSRRAESQEPTTMELFTSPDLLSTPPCGALVVAEQPQALRTRSDSDEDFFCAIDLT
ncbi:phage terminase large subunit family protein [Comamonadaceae bacterium PP-2]